MSAANISPKLSPNDAKVLQALRAGEMSADQFIERFKYNRDISRLTKLGYISSNDSYYRITPAGLAACPKRRQAIDAIATETNAIKSKPVETIALNARLDIASLTKPGAGIFKLVDHQDLGKPMPEDQQTPIADQITQHAAIALKTKPKALQILEYIEKNPGQTSKAIGEALGFYCDENLIKSYIKSQKVIVNKAGYGKNTYAIAPGLKLADFYKKTITPTEQAILKIDAADADQQTTKATELPNAELAGHPTARLRFAITTDETLIILGLSQMPIELTKTETDCLSELLIRFYS